MHIWTVHAPPEAEPDAAPGVTPAEAMPGATPARPSRSPVLLREAFSWAAFLFAPLWFLWHRMWLVLVIYLAVTVLIAMLLPEQAALYAAFALQLLVGFHARDLRRWTLERRGWRLAAIVAAPDEDAAWGRLLAQRPGLARTAALA